MRIIVIGAGAMGGIYGGRLALAGHEVAFIDRRVEHVEAIRRDGLVLEGIGGDHVLRVEAQTTPDDMPPADLLVVFTDASGTADAAQAAAGLLATGGVALTLQNGIGNVEALTAVLGAARVLAGVSMNSGMSPGPGRVRHTNAGSTSIGELGGGGAARAQALADMFVAAGFETLVVADPLAMIWSKFVLNCGVNAISAVTGLRLGEVARTPEVDGLQDRMIDEILAVVAAKGVRLDDPDPRGSIKRICRLRYNKPSMFQHLEAGRRTEIDAINGALVREARALGMAVPYNEAVVAIVKGQERSRRQALHEPPIDYAALEAAAAREEGA
jgi:2-dehydropantoate 2-reductase